MCQKKISLFLSMTIILCTICGCNSFDSMNGEDTSDDIGSEIVIPDYTESLNDESADTIIQETIMPESVSNIDTGVFHSLPSLENVTIAQNNSHYEYIDGLLVCRDGTLYFNLKNEPLDSEVFRNLIKIIQDNTGNYSETTELVVGNGSINIKFVQNGESVDCYATSIMALNHEKIFDVPILLSGEYDIEVFYTDKLFVFSQTKNSIGNWWIFGLGPVYEILQGDEVNADVGRNSPKWYNMSVVSLYLKDDGNIGYIRYPRKYGESNNRFDVLRYCVNREEFCREEGTMDSHLYGQWCFSAEKTYTVDEAFDLESLFEEWKEYTADWTDEMFEENGWPKADSLEEMLEYNQSKYEESSQNVGKPIPVRSYSINSGRAWIQFSAGVNWELNDYTFTEKVTVNGISETRNRMVFRDTILTLEEFKDALESDTTAKYDLSAPITGVAINNKSYVGYIGTAKDGNPVYHFYIQDPDGTALEVKLWQYTDCDARDYLQASVIMIVESFNINSQPPVRLQEAIINRGGRELPIELNENSSEVFAELISEMIENYSDYSDVTAITVGDTKINIMFDKQSSGMYCYAVSVEANGYEKIFREAVQLHGGYTIEFANTDNVFAFGQTKNGTGDWWIFSDCGVFEATDSKITSVINGNLELELSEVYIKDDVLYHGYTRTSEESIKFAFVISYLENNYEVYKDLHSIQIGEFLLKIKFNEHEVLPGETVMYCCLESISANDQELVVNDYWDHGGSAYLGGMLFCANAPENVFVFTKNSNITKTWIFTEKKIIEVPIGNYWDESQPEFYNTSIYNFTIRDDGKLGYIRRPYKALQSVDILGQLYHVVSRDELGREEGYVTIENGEIVYNPEKTYTISELYDLDDYFKKWLLQRSTWNEEILESYGIFGTANSLDELLKYNAERYEPAK